MKYGTMEFWEQNIKQNIHTQEEEFIKVKVYTHIEDNDGVTRYAVCKRHGLECVLFLPITRTNGEVIGMNYWFIPPEGWKEESPLSW